MFRQKDTALTIGLVCAATLAAHVLIARHLERVETAAEAVESRAPLWGVVKTPGVSDWTQESTGVPRLLTTAAYESESPVDAVRSAGEREADSPRPALTRRQREEQDAVRAVIEEEMPETSAEERDIWFDELKSLPAEVVRDLLQVRRQLRVLSPDHPLSGPSALHAHAPHEEPVLAAEPVAQTRQFTSSTDWSETREALEQAMAWSTHNLANAATPGYKRIEAFPGDVYRGDEEWQNGFGCRLLAARLDLSPGELRETGRQLDLAIDGPGLFVLRHEESGETVYTRCGTMTLDGGGRAIGVRVGDKFYVQCANGSIGVPETALSVKISADGSVAAVIDQDKVEDCVLGQLFLASCIDPSQLKPIGDGLFAAVKDFAPPLVKPGLRGVGVIRQGFLEQSNVDVAREQADRAAWESILRTLPTALVPRTAREPIPSPH
jgi:flagellar basal-body rod protein FlgG